MNQYDFRPGGEVLGHLSSRKEIRLVDEVMAASQAPVCMAA